MTPERVARVLALLSDRASGHRETADLHHLQGHKEMHDFHRGKADSYTSAYLIVKQIAEEEKP